MKGVYFGAQAVARRMVKKRRGCIINLSSIGGIQGGGGNALYSTTKGAVRLMTYGLAQELGPKGIRMNAIHPGVIETAMTVQDTHAVGSEASEAFKAMIPLHRFGLPGDIGHAAVYLASYINGVSLIVDGDRTRV